VSPVLLAALFLATLVAELLAFEGGLRLGRWRSQRANPEPPLPARVLVTSTLNMLAFMLAFIFGLASSHYDSRSQSVFDESVAIESTYQRADLLPHDDRKALRQLLRQYVDLRLMVRQPSADDVRQLRALQAQIWDRAISSGRREGGSPTPAPLLQSLTDAIDVHGERALIGVRTRIPIVAWIVLIAIMFTSIASAGYLAGLAGARRSIAATGYALVFAAVIVMIVAADVPGTEQLRTSHQALVDLRSRLTEP
jgi:hypothetical protein